LDTPDTRFIIIFTYDLRGGCNMFKFHCILYLVFSIILLSFSAVITPYIPPNKVKPVVTVKVRKDGNYFTYSYQVTNDVGSEQKISLFGIYIQADYEPISAPNGWDVLIREKGRIIWNRKTGMSNEEFEEALIEPGESLCCFVIRSKYPPVEGIYEALGDTPIPSAEVDTAIEAQIERDYGKGHNIFGDTRLPGLSISTSPRRVGLPLRWSHPVVIEWRT